MIYKIEITLKEKLRDRHAEHLRSDILDIGIKKAPEVKYSQVYKIDGDISRKDIEAVASKLLTDPVTEIYLIDESLVTGKPAKKKEGIKPISQIEVWFKPGVTDTVAESVIKAVRDLGIGAEIKVKTGHKFAFKGKVQGNALKTIAERLLVNPMVQFSEIY